MPAAVAVPAIISVAGMAAKAVGDHFSKKSAKSQAQKNYEDTQNQITANMQKQQAWQDSMKNSSDFQSMMASALAPQTTSTSSSSTAWQDYGPQQGTLDEMMGAAKDSVKSANVLQAQQLASTQRNISGQEQAQRRQIQNVASARGVDPAVASLGMQQGINNARLGAELDIAQKGRENVRTAWGDVNSVLDRYKKQHSRGNSTTTGGPNIGAYLSMQDMLRPQDRPVVQRQAV
jgi:hypothetical protein